MADESNNLLDLEPRSFVAALDEWGLKGARRAWLERQYFERNRALPLYEAAPGKRVGLISPMEFPEGMTGYEAIKAGEAEFAIPSLLRNLYNIPAEAFNVASATLLGIPVSEDQMQQSAFDMGGMLVGGGAGHKVVDSAQRRQAANFSARANNPEFYPPDVTGQRVYVPDSDDLTRMRYDPTLDDQNYISRRIEAATRLPNEMPDVVARDTGVLTFPIRDQTGNIVGFRDATMFDERTYQNMRPDADGQVNVRYEDIGSRGMYDPTTREIVINRGMSPEQQRVTRQHEYVHNDLNQNRNVHLAEMGTDPNSVLRQKTERMAALDRLIKNTSDPDLRDILRAQRSELAVKTSQELYEMNPGEMLARLASGQRTTSMWVSPTELLNPYIFQHTGPMTRSLNAAEQAVRSELSPIGKRLPREWQKDMHVQAPMDLSKAQVMDPNYDFYDR